MAAGLFASASQRRAAFLLLGALLAVAPGCRTTAPVSPANSGATLAHAEVRFVPSPDTGSLHVEIARTPYERRRGLSRRAELPANQGMLFLFADEQPAETSFWMYRTSIPLSIAFLDDAWRIREIRHMRPCRSVLSFLCPAYRSASPFSAALEVNHGYFESRGIAAGARIVLRREPPL